LQRQPPSRQTGRPPTRRAPRRAQADCRRPCWSPHAPPNSELDEHLYLLSSEHPADIQRGVAWLVAHADVSHAAVVDLVQNGGRFDNATYAAVRILGEMRRPEDVALLKSVLHAGKGTLSMEAAKALGTHQTPEAEQALIDSLTAKDRDLVQSALVGLGMHSTQTARTAIEAQLDNPDQAVRYTAVHTLGTMGAAPSLPALRKRRSVERDPEVKAALDRLLRP
jgi:hypothetical protein